jgi:hypothetical protein
MRSFGDPSFFRLLHILLGEAGADVRRTKWSHRGANWVRQRHSFTSSSVGFAIEHYLITMPNPNGWTLLVVKETWWDGDDKSLRSAQWAKPLSGERAKTLEWLKAEERRINSAPVASKAAE